MGASSSDGPFAVTTLAPPGAPSLTAAPGNQQIVLNWRAPSEDGGSNILGYPLAVSETNPASGNESWTVLTTVNQLVTSYTHTGLAMGVTRYYRVRAGTSVAPGPWSKIVSATTHTGLPVVTGTAQVGQTLTADTSGIDDADGLGAFGYQWVRVDGGTDTDIAGSAGATRVLFIDDLGHSLKVRVSWTDGGGTAEALTSAPTAAVIPDVPQVTDVRLFPGNGTLTVTSWTTTAIISPSYQFQIKASSAASWPEEPVMRRFPNPHVFGGLTNGTEYTVRVRGVHLEDDLSTVFIPGSWSDVTGTPAVASAAPGEVTATGLEVAPGVDSADVFWTPVVGAEEYDIQWRTTAGGDEYDPARSARRTGRPLRGKLTAIITRLLPDTEHLLRIRAVNSAGEGPWAETTSTFRTRPADTGGGGGDDGGGGTDDGDSDDGGATDPEPEPLGVEIVGVPDVAVTGESYELTAQSDEESLVYAWRVDGGALTPDTAQTVVWTAPETAGVAWIHVDVTREDGATAGQSAYVRVEVPEPVPALPLLGQLLLALGLLRLGLLRLGVLRLSRRGGAGT